MHKIVKCFETFKSFAFSSPSIRFSNASIAISKREKVSLYSKFHGHDWSDKVYIYKLVCSFCSILGCAIIILCCFCFFIAIIYAFIFNIVDVVACQVFSQSWEIQISKTFIPDREGKYVTLCQMYFQLDHLESVVFGFEEVAD